MHKYTSEEIKELLRSNDRAVIRGLLCLRSFQTTDEITSKRTTHHNGAGFNAFDAEILTDIANRYEMYGRLTTRQFNLVKGKIMKYSGQLAKYANDSQGMGA